MKIQESLALYIMKIYKERMTLKLLKPSAAQVNKNEIKD
tara:strand:+ start:887 stop:1003 length:117 start_codon:yes stop_codon:yes gene_type:complete